MLRNEGNKVVFSSLRHDFCKSPKSMMEWRRGKFWDKVCVNFDGQINSKVVVIRGLRKGSSPAQGALTDSMKVTVNLLWRLVSW